MKADRRKPSVASQVSSKPHPRKDHLLSSSLKPHELENLNSGNQERKKQRVRPREEDRKALSRQKSECKGEFTKILEGTGGRTLLREDSCKRNKVAYKSRAQDFTIEEQDFECDEELETVVSLVRASEAVRKKSQRGGREWEQQVARFEEEAGRLEEEEEQEKFMNLIRKEDEAMADPYYLERRQPSLSWSMRAILIDWMMHVLKEYRCKRDTFHLAVALADRFLSRAPPVAVKEFQLVGAACMYIASKLQEVVPNPVANFAESTASQFTGTDITRMEQRILQALSWELHTPTIPMWANRLLSQWDQYVQRNPLKTGPVATFKEQDEASYKNYREIMQLLDCAVMDSESLQYRPRALVASFLYLMLGRLLGAFTQKHIVRVIPTTSRYLTSDASDLNARFDAFLGLSFGLGLADLHPTIQFCAGFFILPLSFDSPAEMEEGATVSFEDYCSFQSYNPNSKTSLKCRRSQEV